MNRKKGVFFFMLTIFFSQITFAFSSFKCQQKWENILNNDHIKDEYIQLISLCNNEFKKELQKIINTNIHLSYKKARKELFSKIENNHDWVCGVYSGKCIRTSGIPNHQIMNTEHSWPQSGGAIGIAKSDLHHIYPTLSNINSLRNNHPFCEVINIRKKEYDSYYGTSQFNEICFEPRDKHKGSLSRAMFYFSIRYQLHIDYKQEEFFRKWNREFPVEPKEIERNQKVYNVQKNYNPFVHHPMFATLIEDF